MDADALKQFHEDITSGGHPAFEPYVLFRDDKYHTLLLDGDFTLEQLRRIVTAWERLIAAQSEADDGVSKS